ncbi:MAG: elongation factor G [bacterium]|nr:elongation factor G [bacterium]
MKDLPIANVRNVVMLGHAASGKTSLAEALLFRSGMISRLGSVDAKNTVSDSSPEEQERQISIRTANLFLAYHDHHIFLADTPGYADFFGEVVASTSVADGALLVVDAVQGIEVGTQKTWELASQMALPRLVVINKLDKENARFLELLDALTDSFGKGFVPLTIPVGLGPSFTGVVSLLDNNPASADPDLYASCRTRLIEAVAETDENLLEKYFADQPLEPAELQAALRRATIQGTLVPVCACAATKVIGITELLDAIIASLPSPLDRGVYTPAEGDPLSPDPTAPAAAQVFKTVTDPFVGQITYFRVRQGTITAGTDVLNITRGHKERLGDLLLIQGKDQISVDRATPGDIVAVAKLKNTHVNDALGTAKVTFYPIPFPTPVMTLAVQPAKQGDEEKIAEGLHRIREEDPTIIVERHPETHELLVSGLGDVHLDVVFKRLKEKFKVDVLTSIPKVAYHETIRGKADVRYRHKKQTGGAGQFAEVAIRVYPNERDKGYEFIDKIVGGVISSNFIPSVDKGIRSRMAEGVIAGCPVVDIVVELYDGKEHPVDSKDIAFQIAGRMALAEAVEKANPILLEPIMNVEVQCPQQFMGDINGILNAKRGRIIGMDARGDLQIIKAEVPQAEMFKFCGELRSITGGRGSFSMRLSHYAELPSNLAQIVIENYRKSRAQEQG